MGRYDSTMVLSSSGKFFVVDEIPEAIKQRKLAASSERAFEMVVLTSQHQARIVERSLLKIHQATLPRVSHDSIDSFHVTHGSPSGVPIHHSLPGATCIIYLNFLGMSISGTYWNIHFAPPSFPAVFQAKPFNIDSTAGCSTEEKLRMSAIWGRIAEDYAPFQVDVTTERPATFTTTTGTILFTEDTTADSTVRNMPRNGPTTGGVAYLNVFGRSDYVSYVHTALCIRLTLKDTFASTCVCEQPFLLRRLHC